MQGNYAEAKDRLMSEKLMERFILKFPNDPSMDALNEMVAAGDNKGAFRAVHTLKGVAANLAFTKLFQDASNLTEQLRDLKSNPDPELYARLKETYTMVVYTLKQYAESKTA